MSETNQEKPRILLIALICMLFMAVGIYIYQQYIVSGFNDIQEARMMISGLQQEIRTIKSENERLRATIQALRNNDPAAWETATRKYLGWVKPGEALIERSEE